MRIKEAFGKVYGAEMTAKEKKAVTEELKGELAEYDRNHALELDAIILWQLHEQLGFGPKRLKKFFDRFDINMQYMADRYSMNEGDDQLWLCTKKLKDYGIDIAEWNAKNLELKRKKNV